MSLLTAEAACSILTPQDRVLLAVGKCTAIHSTDFEAKLQPPCSS
jgi:hypothetical protein